MWVTQGYLSLHTARSAQLHSADDLLKHDRKEHIGEGADSSDEGPAGWPIKPMRDSTGGNPAGLFLL